MRRKALKLMLHVRRARGYTRRLLATAVVLAVALSSSIGLAQKRKKIVLGEITIEGRVQKPQAFLLLQRQNLNFEGLELKRSFIPKIVKSANQAPF